MRFILGLVAMLSLFSVHAVAGNVSAKISGGSLFVYGDRGDNGLLINSPSAGQIVVTGLTGLSGESTNVNGVSNGTSILNNWTGGIFVYTYEGNDTVFLVNGVVNGAGHFDLGEGSDALSLGPSLSTTIILSALQLLPVSPPLLPNQSPLEFRTTLTVLGLGGKDTVNISSTSVSSYSHIDLGEADDSLTINDAESFSSHFANTLAVYPGNGRDTVSMANFTVVRDLIIDDSLLEMNLTLTSAMIGQNVFIYGTPSIDKVTLINVALHGILQIFTEAGNDGVTLEGIDASQVLLYPGVGDDNVKVDATRSNRLNVFLDPGADTLAVTAGIYSYINLFGSSGNDRFTVSSTTAKEAYVYGEGETDTLVRSGNTIPIFKVYTVENQ